MTSLFRVTGSIPGNRELFVKIKYRIVWYPKTILTENVILAEVTLGYI